MPDPRAAALLTNGRDRVRLIEGTLDPDSVRAAVDGVEQVFCNTDFFATDGVLAEHRHGVTALEAAKAAGVDRFIWSSLDSAVTLTGGTTPSRTSTRRRRSPPASTCSGPRR